LDGLNIKLKHIGFVGKLEMWPEKLCKVRLMFELIGITPRFN